MLEWMQKHEFAIVVVVSIITSFLTSIVSMAIG